MSGDKTNPGRFFEDFKLGETLVHSTPRTLDAGDAGLYRALYPTRFALYSSELFAESCGMAGAPLEELLAFHVAFGKTVPDVSLNAVANLGYAEGKFLRPVYPGETLRAESEVIGLKENSNGKSGVVWVRSRAHAVGGVPDLPDDAFEDGVLEEILAEAGQEEPVAEWVRWVMVRKRDLDAPAPETVIPELATAVSAKDLPIPMGLDFTDYDTNLAGGPHLFDDYEVGERIDHVDGATLEEAEHMMATRLWQNTAKVHFNVQAREDGRRLIYGGHIISLARALSFNGLANAQAIVAINAGAHANPAYAGDTVYAWSEILEKAETEHRSIGAVRLRTVAVKDRAADDFRLKGEDGKYDPTVLLDFDYWALMPRALARRASRPAR
ncbi:MAG: MaoC family dehydratase [Pseudomonadota bacterium]